MSETFLPGLLMNEGRLVGQWFPTMPSVSALHTSCGSQCLESYCIVWCLLPIYLIYFASIIKSAYYHSIPICIHVLFVCNSSHHIAHCCYSLCNKRSAKPCSVLYRKMHIASDMNLES